MDRKLKKYETIGCCGIDCGLCPRYYTKEDSVCPGCGGLNFKSAHPSCGVLSCCAVKNGLEACSGCKDYPCKRFGSESAGYDSFVTHKKMSVNLEDIRNDGMDRFIERQKVRMAVLNDLLAHHDDGRLKSFYCVCCALLPVEKLLEIQSIAQKTDRDISPKERGRQIRQSITAIADSLGIDLQLRKKTK